MPNLKKIVGPVFFSISGVLITQTVKKCLNTIRNGGHLHFLS